MKKYTKILSILLCLCVLVGVVTTIAAAEDRPVVPEDALVGDIISGTYLDIVAPSRVTSTFGYYRDGTGESESAFVDCYGGAGLTDGLYGNPGEANATSNSGLIAAVFNVDKTIKLGAIEIVANDKNGIGDGDINEFAIQAYVNGKWVELVNQTEFAFRESRTVKFTFTTVETSKVRILIYSHWERIAKLKEVTLFEEKEGRYIQLAHLKGNFSGIAGSSGTESRTDGGIADGEGLQGIVGRQGRSDGCRVADGTDTCISIAIGRSDAGIGHFNGSAGGQALDLKGGCEQRCAAIDGLCQVVIIGNKIIAIELHRPSVADFLGSTGEGQLVTIVA